MNINDQIPIVELYDVWYHPWWREHFFLIALSLLAFFCIVAFLWRRYKKLKKSTITDPLQEAFVQLKKIENYMINSEHYVLFYDELVLFIKCYFCQWHHISFESKTDDEIMDLLKDVSLSQDTITSLISVLTRASRAKFAKEVGLKEYMHDDILVCRTLIMQKQQETMQHKKDGT